MSIPISPIGPTPFSPRSIVPASPSGLFSSPSPSRLYSSASPSGLFSSRSTSNTPTLRTSESWVTCSEPGETTALIPHPKPSAAVESTPHDNEDPAPRKARIFDIVRSAIERKKKKKHLLQIGSDALQATQAASAETLMPQQAPHVYKPGRPNPRGAAERQDISSLREFLDAHPAGEESKEELYEPRSQFDWDDSPHGDVSKVSMSQHKHKNKQSVVDKGEVSDDEESEETSMERGSQGILGRLGHSEGHEISGAAMGIVEGEVAGPADATGSWKVLDHVSGAHANPFGPLVGGNGVGGNRSSPRRESVLRMFQDPLWHRTYDIQGEAAEGRQALDQCMPELTSGLPSIPKFLARLKRGTSNVDLRKGTGNAFAQEASRISSMKSSGEIYSGNVGQTITTCYGENSTPSKRGRRQKNAEKMLEKPALFQPYALSPASSSATSPDISPRGLPRGPLEDDWDDAVKWVKGQVKEREARETKEARKRQRDATKEEKKLKKLVAAKDAVKRISRDGFTLKKPLEDITEEEFELVGEAMIAAKASTPTTGYKIRDALFTKMSGNREARDKQAQGIGHCLDNHASLQMVNAIDPNILDQPLVETARSQCDETLRMLEGEVPLPDILVNPFERSSADNTDGQQPSVGLGITVFEEEEQLVKNNLAQSRMSFGTFAAQKRQQQKDVAGQKGSQPKASFLPPLATIEEANTESSRSPSEESGEITAAYETTQLKQHARQSSAGHKNIKEDDAISVNTIESDAIPPPLNVRKLGAKYEDATEGKLGNSLRKIPVACVDRSSQQYLYATNPNSFIPRRNSRFRNVVREASRLRAAKLGNHPAFRDDVEEHDSASEYSDDDIHDLRPDPTSKHARVDSGVGIQGDGLADEGYSTAKAGQQEFVSSKVSPIPAKTGDGNSCRERVPTLTAPIDTTGDDTKGIDMNVLRCELGLAPAQLPVGLKSPKHPNHPFTWHHEKVMCYGVHNPKTVRPGLPTIPENQPVDMTQIHQKQISLGPTKGKIAGVKVCTCCGMHCCRFASLFITSKMATNQDVTEENVRIRAEQRVEKLRAYHPNGIEEYDTFLTCSLCEHKICAGCSTRCIDAKCQAVICVDCTPDTGVCPVHNAE